MITHIQRKYLSALDNVFLFKQNVLKDNNIYTDYKDYCLVSLALNIPGWPKYGKLISIFFDFCLKNILSLKYLTYLTETRNCAGRFVYFYSKCSPDILKQVLVELEDTLYYGRLLDIDVLSGTKTISRQDLGLKPRICMMCNNSSILCIANESHSKQELRQESYRIIKITLDKKMAYSL